MSTDYSLVVLICVGSVLVIAVVALIGLVVAKRMDNRRERVE